MIPAKQLAGLAAGAALLLVPLTVAAAPQPAVAPPFAAYYREHDGMRVLGNPRTGLTTAAGLYAQYFEKGRIEQVAGPIENEAWRFTYGRLAAELIERGSTLPVSGATSSLTYRDLQPAIAPERREPSPQPGAIGPVDHGPLGVFVPVDPSLRSGPGHYVARSFWEYMQRDDLFPGGWLHDIGLPLSAPVGMELTKNGQRRTVLVQVFERTILTEDLENPADYRVERANIGTDYLNAFPAGSQDHKIIAGLADEINAPRDSYRLQIGYSDDSYAVVAIIPHVAAGPGVALLSRTGERWVVFARHGNILADNANDELRNQGVPDLLLPLNNPFYDELRAAALQALNAPAAGGPFSVATERIDQGFARLRVSRSDTVTDAIFMFARLDDQGRWTILNYGSAFDEQFYQQEGIPATLWLTYHQPQPSA
jgi:hypothetical protein